MDAGISAVLVGIYILTLLIRGSAMLFHCLAPQQAMPKPGKRKGAQPEPITDASGKKLRTQGIFVCCVLLCLFPLCFCGVQVPPSSLSCLMVPTIMGDGRHVQVPQLVQGHD